MSKNMKSQLDRMNKKCISIQEMAKKLKTTDLEIRLFMIKYKIIPSSKLEQDYQECAKKLFKVRKKCHFYSEMAQMTGISLTKTRNVCKMYSIKPSKECKCVICETNIVLKNGKHMPKYCSKKCANIGFRGKSEVKKKIIKVCKVCGVSFEGSSNSKYCNNECRDFAKDVRRGIQCLKNQWI